MDHTESLLQKEEMNNCKYLFITGGLAASAYYQLKMEEKFGSNSLYHLMMISAEQPLLSVAAGAAYFGMTENIPSYGKLPRTYSESCKFKLCIAIDFGTDGIGVAYAYNNDIHVQDKWNAKSQYSVKEKPKTIILLDENANAIGFGMDAKEKFSKHSIFLLDFLINEK